MEDKREDNDGVRLLPVEGSVRFVWGRAGNGPDTAGNPPGTADPLSSTPLYTQLLYAASRCRPVLRAVKPWMIRRVAVLRFPQIVREWSIV